MDIDATLTEVKKNAKNPLVESLPRPRECPVNHGLNVNGSEEASCKIGPVIRLSLALDQEEVFQKESKGEIETKQRGRRAFLTAREKRPHSRSRSASNISRK